MSARNGDPAESTPRTVADLLAQYGGRTAAPGGRRRRRADDPDDTAPHAIIDRVLSDSGAMPRLDEHGKPMSPPGPPARAPQQPPPPPAGSPPSRSAAPPRPQPPRMAPPIARPRRDEDPTEKLPRIEADLPRTSAARDSTGPYPAASRRAAPPRPEQARLESPRIEPPRTEPPREPPRTEPAARGRRGPEHGELDWDDSRPQRLHPAPPPPARELAPPARPLPGGPPRVHDDADDLLGDEHDLDELEAFDEEVEDEHDESPAKEWLVMASQLTVGAIGGAALWLGFQWLWQFMPVAALVVALVVITALVWVVRRVRRSDDLQTIVVTVLVGLFVTVSPAALLLLDR